MPHRPRRRERRANGRDRARYGRGTVLVLAAIGALASLPAIATAHGEVDGVAVGVDPAMAVAGVTAVGVIAGVGAAGVGTSAPGAHRHGSGRRWIERLAGPLLVGLGILGAVAGARHALVPAAAWFALGATAAGLVVRRGGRGSHAGATVGIVGLHRLVEGLAVAALLAGNSAVGAVTAVLVAGHAAAECLAIGGHPALGRRYALTAVVAVQAAFLGAALAGSIALGGGLAVESGALSAAVGGALVVSGVHAATDAKSSTITGGGTR